MMFARGYPKRQLASTYVIYVVSVYVRRYNITSILHEWRFFHVEAPNHVVDLGLILWISIKQLTGGVDWESVQYLALVAGLKESENTSQLIPGIVSGLVS